MLTICVWADDTIKNIIYEELLKVCEYRTTLSYQDCDVFIVDIANPKYMIDKVLPQLRILPQSVIRIILTKDSSPLFDIVGIYIFQFILHQDLQNRLPACF